MDAYASAHGKTKAPRRWKAEDLRIALHML